MELIASILLIFLMLVSFFLVLIGLPGTWLLVLGALLYGIFYPFDGGQTSLLWVLFMLVMVAGFAELLEFVVGTFGAKKFSVSNGGILAAFIGGMIGLMVGVPVFLVGGLLGMLLGAFLGAWLYEGVKSQDATKGFKQACAVLATRVVAILLKSMVLLGMSVYLIFKIY